MVVVPGRTKSSASRIKKERMVLTGSGKISSGEEWRPARTPRKAPVVRFIVRENTAVVEPRTRRKRNAEWMTPVLMLATHLRTHKHAAV
jgi:hypothetical protein